MIASWLGHCPRPIALDIADNNIGDEGAIALAAALKDNSTLTSLDVAGNDIRVSGVAEFAAALTTNLALTSLALGNEHGYGHNYKAIYHRLTMNKEAEPLALAAAEAFKRLPTSWEWELTVEVCALIVKDMITLGPDEGDGLQGLKSLVVASDIVKRRNGDETS